MVYDTIDIVPVQEKLRNPISRLVFAYSAVERCL